MPLERHLDRSALALVRFALELDMLVEHAADVFGISGRDVRAISHVAIAGPLSATRLADRLQVSRGAMTGIVRRLHDGGWVEARPDPDDGRRLIVSSSDRTQELIRAWLCGFRGELREAHPDSVPHPSFPHDLTAVAVVLERQRARLRSMGPAELRALADLLESPAGGTAD